MTGYKLEQQRSCKGTEAMQSSSSTASMMLNQIDLTNDNDQEHNEIVALHRSSKRPRLEPSSSASSAEFSQPTPRPQSRPEHVTVYTSSSPSHHGTYRPAFASSSSFSSHASSPRPSSASFASPSPSGPPKPVISEHQVIDLTTSPSPPPRTPPQQPPTSLPADLPPQTPVCIGLLTVTALVLYPIPFLIPRQPHGADEWAPVRLQHEHDPHKLGNTETIHIKAPNMRGTDGEAIIGESFGVVEQKVATTLGPMMGKGLIRMDGKIKKQSNLSILPLQMLVYTPKGNIPVVGNYLQQCGLLLDHPFPGDMTRFTHCYYYNPHNPPPGGHNRTIFASNRLHTPNSNAMRWTTAPSAAKSVEVQRSQIDELFKSLKDGDELPETEPSTDIGTKLYPHQKKALTFLLEREREKPNSNGSFSSLWQRRQNPLTHQPSWFHIVTQKEVFEEPHEAKGAILADDMGLGKTIACISLIAATLTSARAFASSPLYVPPPPREPEPPDTSQFVGRPWGAPLPKSKSSQSTKHSEKLEFESLRASQIKANSRATLIVCPLSTVSNWEDQFREHWRGPVTIQGGSGTSTLPPTPSQSFAQLDLSSSTEVVCESKPIRQGTALRLYVYHGNARRPDPFFLADFDVVITTYATLATEFSRQNKTQGNEDEEDDNDMVTSDGLLEGDVEEHDIQASRTSNARKGGVKRKKPCTSSDSASPLQSIRWFRVVLDEAHSIKEIGTVGSRASCNLAADRRLCLTGTPVQNKLDDVFALIKFLRLEPFDDKNTWTEYIGTPVKFGQALGVARLQTIMKCITLRRTKETKTAEGKTILCLPPRRDELRYLQFDSEEQEIYDQFFNESKAEFTEMTTKNEVMKNYVGILQKILRLRQICDHFELVRGKSLNQDGQACPSYDDILAAISREGLNSERAAAIFAILRESATTQCVECGSELCSEQGSQPEFPESDTATPKRGRKLKGSASRASTRANSPSAPHPVLTKCQHLFCIDCYRSSICPGWPAVAPDVTRSCSVCQTPLLPSDAIEVKPDLSAEATSKRKTQRREKRSKGVVLENFHPSTKVKALLTDLIQFSRANPYSANYDPSAIEIQVVDGQGNHLDDGVVKTVVFSQWTSMLDKIEDALEVAGIRYDRLDGTMKRDERTRAMDALKYDPGCEVLLVSLKAGGVGLNLTAAQRVYLMDPYWNPAVENQAVDRIHRLGQTRPVTTVKLVIENSIEARLLEVQKKKTELANMTLGHNLSKADLLQRRMEELAQLFG